MIIKKKVDLTLKLIDDHSREPPKGLVRFFAVGETYNTALKPIIKKDGYIIFCNLDDSFKGILIESEFYNVETLEIPKDYCDPLQVNIVRLKPKTSFNFANSVTRVYFKTVDNAGKRLEVGVCGYIDDKENYQSRIMEVSEGSYRIPKISEDIMPGDEFVINGDGSRQLKIGKKLETNVYSIEMLSGTVPEVGDKLYKAIFTKTDKDGNGVMYFSSLNRAKVDIKIYIEKSSDYTIVDSELIENTVLNLGEIIT